MFIKYCILIFGIFACSSSVIFIKLGDTHPILLAAYRLILASLILFPVVLKELKKYSFSYTKQDFLRINLPAFILAIHFVTWIMGARMTPAANASLIVNMVPVAMPVLLYFILREKLSRRELWGTLISVSGVVILSVSDFNLSRSYAYGDLVCFISMILVSSYLVVGRRINNIPSIWLYVTPLYFISGLYCLLLGVVLKQTVFPGFWIGEDLKMGFVSIIGLTLMPTIIGHSILNWGMQSFRGQVVAVLNVWQFMFAAILAYFVFNEIPRMSFYIACICIITGAYIVIRNKKVSKV